MNQQLVKLIREGSILKYLLKQTGFMFAGVLLLASFSLVDLFFIGKLGAEALAAISFASTVVMMVVSFLIGFGSGVSAVIANKIGEGNQNIIGQYLRMSLIYGLLIGLCITFLGFAIHSFLFSWLGARTDTIRLITLYVSFIYPGFFLLTLLVIILSAIRATGNTKVVSLIIGMLVIINLVFDPILIFGFGPIPALGMQGAAIATVLAIGISLVFSVYQLKVAFPGLEHGIGLKKLSMSSGGLEILQIGLPIAATNLILPVGNSLLTKLIAGYGQQAVAAFGISYRLDIITIFFFIALTATLTPFLGQNRGNRNLVRIRKGVGYSLGILIAFSLLTATILLIKKREVGEIFTENQQILAYVELYFTWVPWGYAFNGIVMVTLAVLNVFYKPFTAAGLALLHLFIFYIPLAFGLSNHYGIEGIFMANPISYMLVAGMGIWWIKSMLSEKKN